MKKMLNYIKNNSILISFTLYLIALLSLFYLYLTANGHYSPEEPFLLFNMIVLPIISLILTIYGSKNKEKYSIILLFFIVPYVVLELIILYINLIGLGI